MFPSESMWGIVARLALNRAYPEATMAHTVSDVEAAKMLKVTKPALFEIPADLNAPPAAPGSQGGRSAAAAAGEALEAIHSLPDNRMNRHEVVPLGKGRERDLESNRGQREMTTQDLDMLIQLYCREVVARDHGAEGGVRRSFSVLWGLAWEHYAAEKGLEGTTVPHNQVKNVREHWQDNHLAIHAAQPLNQAELKFVCLSQKATFYDRVMVGDLKLRRQGVAAGATGSGGSCCFLSAPNDAQDVAGHRDMYFGKVEAILEHVGPDDVKRCIMRVKWHHAQRAFDSLLMTPVVPSAADAAYAYDRMWLCSNVIPWLCWMAPHPLPRTGRKQVVLARHWHILQEAGYPLAGPI